MKELNIKRKLVPPFPQKVIHFKKLFFSVSEVTIKDVLIEIINPVSYCSILIKRRGIKNLSKFE